MGKFFDTLRKSEKSISSLAGAPVFREVVKIPSSDIDELRVAPSPEKHVVSPPPRSIAGTDPRLVRVHDPTSPAAESFRILCSKLLLSGRDESRRLLLVTSAQPEDGKTLVAANLAVSIALGTNFDVVLVDCDLRRPSLHNTFGCQARSGLREYLEAGHSLGPYLINTPIERLTLLPGGKPRETGSDLLNPAKVRLLVDQIKNHYRDPVVIFDTPPIRFFADGAHLCSVADGVLLVVRCGRTSRALIQEALASVGREKILGVVFNASDEGRRDYKHYYHYYRRQREPASEV